MKRVDKIAQDTYLSILAADNYPEQEPAYKNARWYDLFWLLIPIVGFLVFVTSIESRQK